MAQESEKKKAKRPTPEKRRLQSEKRREQNRQFKSKVRTAIRTFEKSLTAGDKKACQQRLDVVYSLMDKGVKNGSYKLNKASRTKSRLSARLAAIS